jgi:hypothetical protein
VSHPCSIVANCSGHCFARFTVSIVSICRGEIKIPRSGATPPNYRVQTSDLPTHQLLLTPHNSPAGMTVCLMIFVDNLGGWFPPINHSDWNYVTLADFVMPFFLFMVSNSA